MENITLAHRRYVNNSGQKLGIADGKACGARDVYVVQHNQIPTTVNKPSQVYQITKTSSPSSKSCPWYSSTEINRKKRITKYKLYSMEGKVKISIKKGYRWFKKTCSRISHGF